MARKSTLIAAQPASYMAVGLADLEVDPRNARAGRAVEDVEALAANIEAFGLLSPLIGVARPDGRVAVLDGRRRLAALLSLDARGAWGRPVQVILRPEADAEGAALAANTHRLQLNAAQEARAFARMLDAATARTDSDSRDNDDAEAAITAIARAFGVTVLHVEQRLKLARLHPPIIDALDAGQIRLDEAKAYARGPVDRQARVWAEVGARGHLWQIRREMEKGALRADCPEARAVSEAAYLAAGGRIARDLFGTEADALWLDPEIAAALAREAIDDERKRLEAEGWGVVEIVQAGDRRTWADDADAPGAARRAPDPAEAARLADIARERAALARKLDELDGAPAGEGEDLDAMEERIDDLDHEEARIEDGLKTWSATARVHAAAIVWLGERGISVRRGVAAQGADARAAGGRRADVAGEAGFDGGDGEDGCGAHAAAPPPKRQHAMTAAAHQAATRAAGAILGRALAASPNTALVAVTAAFVRAVLQTPPARGGSPLALTISPQPHTPGPRALALAGDKAYAIADHGHRSGLKPFLRAAGALEAELDSWAPDNVLRLLAHCVAACVSTAESGEDARDEDMRARAAALGRAARCDPGLEWTPDLEMMKAMSPPALEAAALEMGVDLLKGASKAAVAATLAERARETKWTPPAVRAICGATFAPIVRPSDHQATASKMKAGKKTAAKKPGNPGPADKTEKADKADKPGKAIARKPPARSKAPPHPDSDQETTV